MLAANLKASNGNQEKKNSKKVEQKGSKTQLSVIKEEVHEAQDAKTPQPFQLDNKESESKLDPAKIEK